MNIGCNFFAFMFIFVGFGDDTPPETSQTIELLGQAQKANESRYPSGRMRFELRNEWININESGGSTFEVIEGESRWREDFVHTKLTRYGPSASEIDTLDLTNYTLHRHVEYCILNKSQFVAYFGQPKVIIAPRADRNLAEEQHVTPRDYWYVSQFSSDMPCIQSFDKATIKFEGTIHPSITAIQARDGEVRLERKDAGTGERFSAIFSYQLDGNVTKFDYENPQSKNKHSRNFTWMRDSQNRVFLSKAEGLVSLLQNGRSTSTRSLYKTIDFDPTFQPASDVFTIQSLKLPPGVLVRDDIRKVRYRIGEASPGSVFETIEGLAESMRSKGFALPGR